jgi:hypothetical protein
MKFQILVEIDHLFGERPLYEMELEELGELVADSIIGGFTDKNIAVAELQIYGLEDEEYGYD